MNKQAAALLAQHFDTAFSAPNGIKKLRELILTLAMQGKLVAQDPNDAPASQLLEEIEAEKKRLVKEGKIKAPKSLLEIKLAEVPYALPQGWEWMRLGDVCSYIQRGKGPTYADCSLHRVISQKCVRWYGLDLEPARFIETESLSKYESIRFLKGGDLLWNSTGTGTIGRACLVPDELEQSELVADSHVTIVRALLLNTFFLLRWIQSPAVQNGIETAASGTTNQIELNTSTVINHLMPVPPLTEQHRIVAKIDQLMARCDALEYLRNAREEKRLAVHAAALTQLLDISSNGSPNKAWAFITQHFGELYAVKENVTELRKAILQLAVMGKLVPQDPNDSPASQLLKEIEIEKKRLIKEGKFKNRGTRRHEDAKEICAEKMPYALPEGWEWVSFGDISLSSDSGWSPQCLPEARTGNEWGVLKVSAVSWGSFNPSENKALPPGIDPKSECEVMSGDLLLSRANTDELVARSVIVDKTPPRLMMSDKIVRFSLSQFVNKSFINVANGSLFARAYYVINASGTSSSMKNVTRNVMINLPIALPPLSEQVRIVAKIDQLMELCGTLEQRIATATGKQTELLNAVMAQV